MLNCVEIRCNLTDRNLHPELTEYEYCFNINDTTLPDYKLEIRCSRNSYASLETFLGLKFQTLIRCVV